MPVILATVAGTVHQEAHDALARQWPDYGIWIIDPEDDFDYGEYIRYEWCGDDDLIIVEQDVVLPPDAIMNFLACPGLWCAHEIDLGGHLSARTLSLVRFSRALQERLPNLAEMALPRAGDGRPQVPWRSVDVALTRVLDFSRIEVHVHQPPARHLHRYPGSPPADPAPATPEPPV